MRLRVMSFSVLFSLLSAISYAQSSGPGDRQITDPKSVESDSNPSARPVSIDDLYFTRSVSNASWSPDGNEMVFTTDITGRSNLWKVSSRGGWPIQLAQSDERQYGETWSPDGKWIAANGEKIPELVSASVLLENVTFVKKVPAGRPMAKP